ncbi:MAG TPA: hypothetical protein VNZ47_13815 [Candidatus Dormibacteraeota bacterium]|jgi:hypothetical protein|nr:hypothetical protein [Candidatus Dormibacteraeota bacterium]
MLRLIRTLTVMVALMGILQTAALAQNGRMGTHASQGVLTIQVQVVPAAMLPAQAVHPGNQSVSYSIPVAPAQLSVIEKKQLVNFADSSGKIEARLVNVVTVVPE